MPYFLLVSDEAKARLKKLKKKDSALARRIINKFDDIIENPYRFEILSGDLYDARKAKVWKKRYRIIFDIHQEENAVVILLFGHRDYIYGDTKLFEEFAKSKEGEYINLINL